MNLSEVLNSINYSKEDIFGSLPQVTDKEYAPFVVNKCLSYFPDTILQANNMNISHHIDNRMQYHYLMFGLRKRKRFSKWSKSKQEQDIEAIKSVFGYSNAKAEECIKILNEKEIEDIVYIYTHNGQ